MGSLERQLGEELVSMVLAAFELEPDEQGWWSALLPVQIPLLLESLPWDCGRAGSWWAGALAFTPTQPPPAVAPVLKLQETPLPTCPPPLPPAAGSPRRNRPKATRRSCLP